MTPLIFLSAWPKSDPFNPYLELLYSRFEDDGIVVDDYRHSLSLPKKITALHIHWPEGVFWGQGDGWIGPLAKTLMLSVNILRIKLRRGIVITTLHNATPHQSVSGPKLLVSRLANWITRRSATLVLAMSEHDQKLVASEQDYAVSQVILHPHYRDIYNRLRDKPSITPNDGPYTIGMVGRMRPSKRVDHAAELFSHIPGDQTLLVAGDGDQKTVEKLRNINSEDERVILELGALSDKGFVDAVLRCKAILLNQWDITNSGSVLAALSLDTPVIAPSVPNLEELASEVGSNWLHLYQPPLTKEALARVLSELREAGLTQARAPLQKRDPQVVSRRAAQAIRRHWECKRIGPGEPRPDSARPDSVGN
ncbi:Glycosyltransferase involved in cell wall bisynthesis [Rhizobium sp. NFR07]|uniref:glycosyltransferase n=1 Tax=Rhizobium sp. NFR07 TaxID=1566262 RepID=UPI0008EDFA39|nr:glycosyltransferase [Rhizobium sp. NFR07]SFB51079.1 Glycosyltransferase involved in cell wall bisynthesis [Rhizobium sp. NFR07]